MASDQTRRGNEPDDARDGSSDSSYVPGTHHDDYDDPYAHDADDRPHLLARRLFQVAVAVMAVALFLGVVWYAYIWGQDVSSGDGELPVVTAEDGPEKVEPEDPGGMDVPHQDKLVMNEDAGGSGDKVERLLPPPETPQPPEGGGQAQTVEPGQPADGTDDGESADGGGETASDGAAGEIDQTQEVAELPETAPEDGGVDNQGTSDGTDGGDQAADSGSGVPDTPPAPSESEQTEQSADASAQSADTQAAEPEPEETQTAAAEPTQAESTATGEQQAAPQDGGFAVQLAALREKAAAQSAWQGLQQKYPDLLGDRQLLLQSAQVEGRGTFWRVRTGPFADRAAANALCTELKAQGQDCLAVSR